MAILTLFFGSVGVVLAFTPSSAPLPPGFGRAGEIRPVLVAVPAWVATAVAGWSVARVAGARAVGLVLLSTSVLMGAWLLQDGLWHWWYDICSSCGRTERLSDWSSAGSETLQLAYMWIPLALLPHVYPRGLMQGRPWRILFGAAMALFAVAVACRWQQGTVVISEDGPRNPTPWLLQVLNWILYPLFLISFASALVVLGCKWRRGTPLVRRQIAVLGAALLIYAGLFFGIEFFSGLVSHTGRLSGVMWAVGDFIMGGGAVLVVAAIAVAVQRYNMYDLRVVIRRVVVYGAVTALVTIVFVGVCVSAAVAAPVGRSPWVAAVLAAVAVVSAEGLRRRLQRRIEHRFLGDRGDPLRAMSRLSDHLSTGGEARVLTAVVDTIAAAVRSPSVALGLQRGPQVDVVTAVGAVDPGALVLPLLYRQERLGELRVGARTPGERYGRGDLLLLEQLAAQAAAHVYGLRRDAELFAARQEALTASTGERARVGRDLHDELAPLIAGAGLAAEALRRGMVPGSADEQDAGRLAQRLRSAATELRRVAHDLQPGPLADQGLQSAIEDYVATLTGPDAPMIEVHIPSDRLPSAVEVVVYRVVLEALANVVRHAGARRSTVVVTRSDKDVTVDVLDDGTGLHTPYVSGLGIASMRSRVEALGGEFTLEALPGGGTRLRARMPLER